MYQLVRKKKRNIFLKIIGVLVACAVIKELLLVLFGPASVSRQLDDFANSVNKRCPLVVDSITRLINCSAGNGDKLHLNYQITTVDKEEVDSVSMMINCREAMINSIKTDPSMAIFKQQNISLSASYYDKTGKYICGVTVLPSDLKN